MVVKYKYQANLESEIYISPFVFRIFLDVSENQELIGKHLAIFMCKNNNNYKSK